MKQKKWLIIISLSCWLTSNAAWSCDDLCIGHRAKRMAYQAHPAPAHSQKHGKKSAKGAVNCELKLNSVEVQGSAPGVVIHQNAIIDTLIVNC